MTDAGYNRFSCPHCDAELNPGRGPILQMRGRLDAPTFSVVTDVFIPSALGVYGRLTVTNVTLREGAKIEFFCPQCGADFSSAEDDLAHVRMRDDEGRDLLVGFNKHYGKCSTFVIDPREQEVRQQYGVDADAYRDSLDDSLEMHINFFGE